MAKGSVDMILTDLPYGKNIKERDKEIDIRKLWDCFNHVLKDDGVVILTSIEPFTSKLIMSNIDNFKYKLIWVKTRISNPLLAKKMPSKIHEEILIFYKNTLHITHRLMRYRKNMSIRERTLMTVHGWQDNSQVK